MASPQVFTAVQTYLAANWSDATAHLAFENDRYEPDGSSHFVLVEIIGDFYDQASIGADPITANLWREEGTINFHVMMPRGEGSLVGRQIAYALAQLFRGNEIGNLRFLTQSIGSGQAQDETGRYAAMTLTVDWQRDE